MNNKQFFAEMYDFFKQSGITVCKLEENPSYLNTFCNVFPNSKGTRTSVWWRENNREVLLSIQSENENASRLLDNIFEKHKNEFMNIDKGIQCEDGKESPDWRRINISFECNGDFSGIIDQCKNQSIKLIDLFNAITK